MYLIIEFFLKITSVCGMLIVGKVGHVWEKGAYGKSLCFPLNFVESKTSLKNKVHFLKSKGQCF